jgi:hypothetical protein
MVQYNAVVKAGVALLAIIDRLTAAPAERPGRTVSARCTGIRAVWCPVHGVCTCTAAEYAKAVEVPTCPLHAMYSKHGVDPQQEGEE